MGNAAVPTVEITMSDDGVYQLKTITTFKTTCISFKLGEPFEEETADGRKVQVRLFGCDGTMNSNTNPIYNDIAK